MMMMFTFSIFDHKYLSWANFGPNIQNCLFKVKFDTKTNSNMQNSMVVSVYCICFRLKIATLCGQIWYKKSHLSV